ncbi:MAG: hypothetical protein IJ637_01170 [Prevotella sp.]|nr:hypothetical protein [Prevotella sp.]
MKLRTIIAILLVLITMSASAQRRRAAKTAKPTISPEQIERQERIASMREATAKVIFIDSLVVDKADFLKYYNLSPESGSLKTYQEHFKKKNQPNGYVYIPEIDNKEYFSIQNNEGIINLYIREKTAGKWNRQTRVRGINDDKAFTRVNYPFMLGDGQTLYFAAEGPEGVGGYDIYITRYDADKEKFLKPENIGMPFNSEANDYMYVIDEYDSLGWFATDRNQPEGKVCIYTFIPPAIRQTYSSDEYTPEQISAFANLASIAATWDDKEALDAALARKRMAAMRKRQQETGREFVFIVNDDITYTHLSDFKAPNNQRLYRQLIDINNNYHVITKRLSDLRQSYASAKGSKKDAQRKDILDREQKQYELFNQIQYIEKQIRNAEINYLKQKK